MGDIEKRFLGFNCQKKLNKQNLLIDLTSGSPDINRNEIFGRFESRWAHCFYWNQPETNYFLFVHPNITTVYTFTSWTIFLMNFWKKKQVSIFSSNLILKIQLTAKNRFSISPMVFPQSSWVGKNIDDIEKRFFAFNCQLKKLNKEVLF
jgi:hypothetical protein